MAIWQWANNNNILVYIHILLQLHENCPAPHWGCSFCLVMFLFVLFYMHISSAAAAAAAVLNAEYMNMLYVYIYVWIADVWQNSTTLFSISAQTETSSWPWPNGDVDDDSHIQHTQRPNRQFIESAPMRLKSPSSQGHLLFFFIIIFFNSTVSIWLFDFQVCKTIWATKCNNSTIPYFTGKTYTSKCSYLVVTQWIPNVWLWDGTEIWIYVACAHKFHYVYMCICVCIYL